MCLVLSTKGTCLSRRCQEWSTTQAMFELRAIMPPYSHNAAQQELLNRRSEGRSEEASIYQLWLCSGLRKQVVQTWYERICQHGTNKEHHKIERVCKSSHSDQKHAELNHTTTDTECHVLSAKLFRGVAERSVCRRCLVLPWLIFTIAWLALG